MNCERCGAESKGCYCEHCIAESVDKAEKTVQGYSGRTWDLEADLMDLLVDIRHLAAEYGIDMGGLLKRSRNGYQLERGR